MPSPELDEQFASFEAQDDAMRLGMWAFLCSEGLLFGGLFALYGAYKTMYGADFDDAIRENTKAFGTVNTYILLTSSLTVALAVWAARRNHFAWIVRFLLLTILQGFAFLFVKSWEYAKHVGEGALPGPFYHFEKLPTFGANRFFTLYWVMTGLHALHVIVGIGVLMWLAVRARSRIYRAEHHVTLEMGTLYWHFVDVVWIFLWPLLYLV